MAGLAARFWGACLGLWLGLCAATAAEVSFPSPGDVVPGVAGITYLDLLREIVPDLEAVDGSYRGRTIVTLRHISGPDWEPAPPEEAAVGSVSALALDDGRLLVLADLGQASDAAEGFAVLGLFDPAKKPRLVDAADVAFDRMTWFLEPVTLDLGAGGLAVLTMSMHSNSSQAYVTSAIVSVGERLELIDSVFTFDERNCTYERTQRLAVETRAEGDGPAAIAGTIMDTTTPTGNDCGDEAAPAPATATIAVTWRWDEAERRYKPDSDAFERLAAEAEERF